MKLSVSNIGWPAQKDEAMYLWLQRNGFSGIEIAPTRLFPKRPYKDRSLAEKEARRLKEGFGLEIPSMQSIWYGMSQRIAGPQKERDELYQYTKEAIDFASACGCYNLVFGCPRNRTVLSKDEIALNEAFLLNIANYAQKHQVVIALEANPAIYHTNYINTTSEAIETIRKLNDPALKLNLDIGTILENNEGLELLKKNIDLISHIHISEPGLKPLQERQLHRDLKNLLSNEKYQGFVSLEMARPPEHDDLIRSCLYLKEVFGS